MLVLENDVRRDLHLFMLLSGMRRTAAVEARVEHLDLARGCLRVPNPKGGTAKAFDLPLSGPLLDLCRDRPRATAFSTEPRPGSSRPTAGRAGSRR